MSEPFVLYEQQDRVVTLTLNNPDMRNAISTHSDCNALIDSLDRANDDKTVSCLILTGRGSAFCAGGDIKSMKKVSAHSIGLREKPDATRANYKRGIQRMISALWENEIPTIAAINGHAIGLGLDLATLCDIRITVPEAKFASSFIKLGLVPGDGGAWVLPRAVGLARAAEMIYTGDMIDAKEARDAGIVSRIVDAEELLSVANEIANKITVNPPRALRMTKRLLRDGQQRRLADVLELSAAFQAMCHETGDHKEAVNAFIEKRTPEFTGN